MRREDITSLKLYQKKKNALLYQALSPEGPLMVKCLPAADSAKIQALQDEYDVLKDLSHPSIPAYYGLFQDYRLPDLADPVLALCMQDCSAKVPIDPFQLTPTEIFMVLYQLTEILSWLLDKGILYTDLNPTNLILSRPDSSKLNQSDGDRMLRKKSQISSEISVCLVDFTCCYFFLKNPNPEYSLRFSYDLSPDLKGRQLLIQELSFLAQDLIKDRTDLIIPPSFYRLIEEGRKPADHLEPNDYQGMILEAIRGL